MNGLPVKNPPIIEAVLDLDYDLPVDFDLARLEEPAQKAFAAGYPILRKQILQQYQLRASADVPPAHSFSTGLQALRFLAADEKQLVQIRTNGYSFNRLAPYEGFEKYLPEIERTWLLFAELARPVQLRRIALRYINRIVLPTSTGEVNLDEYLKVGPRLADEKTLRVAGFFNQYTAIEATTSHTATVSMVMQPLEGGGLPIIFDNAAAHVVPADRQSWQNINEIIQSLRRLKNHVFEETLTEKCLNLFR